MAIVKLRVEIPIEESILHRYDSEAVAKESTLEQVLGMHLARTASLEEGEFVVLSAAQMAEIRSMLGNKVSTAKKIVDMIRRLTTMKIGGLSITLTPNQQEQVAWYARSAGKEKAVMAKELVERAIARELKVR